MQYEAIILELLSRVKALENEISNMKERIDLLENTTEKSGEEVVTKNTKITEEMIDACYVYGKKAHSDSRASISDYADLVAQTTQMNRSSAFISISVVKSLLEGSVYKRALSIKALRRYFSAIYTDFGKAGLVKAIYATREHIKYRESCGLPFGSVVALCNEFEKKI